MRVSLAILIAVIAVCGYCAAQEPAPATSEAPEPAEVETPAPPPEKAPGLRIQHVRGNIYMIEGKGGNIAVSAGDDGLLMVDNQYISEAESIRTALTALGKGELKYVLNTHWHRDHTEGNEVFGPLVPVIAHEQVRERLKGDKYSESALPDITYRDTVTVHFNGEPVRVVHVVEGHTDGDSIVFFTESNVLHLGDQFFSGRLPFIDLNSGGSVEGYIENVAQILEEVPKDALLIPGHGPLSTVDELAAFHVMLKETVKIVRDRMSAGQNVEAVKQAGLPDPWSKWAWEFIDDTTYLEIVFNGLKKGRASRPAAPPKPGADLPPQLLELIR